MINITFRILNKDTFFNICLTIILLYNQKNITFMKKLELNQMELVKGTGCVSGAMGLSFSYMASGAAIVGGFWGLGAAALVGCAAGYLAEQ